MSLLTGKLVAFGKLSFIQVSKGSTQLGVNYGRGRTHLIRTKRHTWPWCSARDSEVAWSIALTAKL